MVDFNKDLLIKNMENCQPDEYKDHDPNEQCCEIIYHKTLIMTLFTYALK